MPHHIRPLSFKPPRLNGLSQRLIDSHYENNYGGAVRRLNAIDRQLATLDPATAPNFLLNGLKREQLIAANSAVLHEIYFDGLGAAANPAAIWRRPSIATSATWRAGGRNSSPWARRWPAARAGSCCAGRRRSAAW